MGKFIDDMVSLGIESLFAFPDAKKKLNKANSFITRLVSGSEEVPVGEFLDMYDLRIHDFHSKQDDIKFMKDLDFEGVYVLHNCTKDIFHVGRATRVFRKVDRIFRGYENQEVYKDWCRQNKFTIMIVPLENSGFNDSASLEKQLRKKYGTYEEKKKTHPSSNSRNGVLKKIFGILR